MPRRLAVRRPELGELEALIAAIRAGSIGEGARRLGVSQPALSKRLRQLEAIVGAPLLERSTRGVTPTPAGSQLAAAALRVVDQVAALDDLLAELRGTSAPVRIASSPVVADRLLPELLAEAADDLSGVAVELTSANSSVVRRLLNTAAADLGIVAIAGEDAARDPEFAEAPCIGEDEIVIGVPASHPWRARESVTLEEVAAADLVLRDPRSHTRLQLDTVLEAHGLGAVHPRSELGSSAAAIATALRLGLPAVLSSFAIADDERLVSRPIAADGLSRRFVLLEAAGQLRPQSVGRVRDALVRAVAARGA